MSGYETTRIADLRRIDGWSPIRRFFDIRSFGVNAWTAAEVDGVVIPDHDEEPTGHEELYLVLEGRATFVVAGHRIDAPSGAIVFVRDPKVTRGAIGAVADTTLLGGQPRCLCAARQPRVFGSQAFVDRGARPIRGPK